VRARPYHFVTVDDTMRSATRTICARRADNGDAPWPNVEHVLVPTLKLGYMVVLDNLGSHRCTSKDGREGRPPGRRSEMRLEKRFELPLTRCGSLISGPTTCCGSLHHARGSRQSDRQSASDTSVSASPS
jgi:hypothetical protein